MNNKKDRMIPMGQEITVGTLVEVNGTHKKSIGVYLGDVGSGKWGMFFGYYEGKVRALYRDDFHLAPML